MKNYVKDNGDYQELEFDAEAIKKSYERRKKNEKYPTSVNLPEEIVLELKQIAQKKGVPYQTLMRMLIIEGLEKLKKSA